MIKTVTIEKLIFGGQGLARTDEGALFVADVCPGETVEVAIEGSKAQTPFGRPLRILSPSPNRRVPPCPHAASCGGCNWQHVTYETQLACKRDIFIDCFSRIGKIRELPHIETFASPEWHYRLRARLHVDIPGKALGMCKRRSNNVARLQHCLLMTAGIDRLFERQEEIVRMICPGTSELQVLAGTDGSVASYPALAKITAAHTQIDVAGLRFKAGGGDFFQNNIFLLQQLGTWPRNFIGGNFFIDLFGGTGFFAALCARQFSRGVLIDSDNALVQRARDNFSCNNIDNLDACAVTSENFVHTMATNYPQADCIIVDPPRPGLSETVRDGLCTLKPSTIVYISCNPSTQARDVSQLISGAQYHIEKAALFDLYPQTHHMETIVILRR